MVFFLIFQSQYILVQAVWFPISSDNRTYVHQIINDDHITDDCFIPTIDVVELRNRPGISQMELDLSGQPNLTSRYVYRILIG